jgi:dTDP-4-amino-4,6-dideoxygalactose transaminase
MDRIEYKAVERVLRSGRLTQGSEITAFEKEFANYIGTKYALTVANGTIALHLALLALHIGVGDEVITTPFSFVASANAILYVGARPVFVDIGEDYNIDVHRIEKSITKRTKAIVPVHLFGKPCNMEVVGRIAQKYKLMIIEDACQAHGATYKGKKVGSFGDVGCFSFYATKNMTTGEGGMVTTNDPDVFERMQMLRSHGSKVRYYHDMLGYNFRMTEMQAAIGREQLKKLDSFNQKRIQNAHYLTAQLKHIQGIRVPIEDNPSHHVYHQYSIRIQKPFPLSRGEFMKVLQQKGIGTSVYYPVPIHKQKQFIQMGYKQDYSISEEISREIVSIPVYPGLTKKQLDEIISVIKEAAIWKKN